MATANSNPSAPGVADRPISFYPQGWKKNDPLDFVFKEVHRGVQGGRWAQKIAWLRDRVADKGAKGPDGKLTSAGQAYQDAKKALPCFTAGGTFRRGSRMKASLQEPSGIRLLELDDLDPTAAEALRDRCKGLPYVVAAWVSSSGRGLHLFAVQEPRATGKDDHASWQALATAVERDLDVRVSDHDASVKDISRVAYVSHDPAAWINMAAVPEPWTPPADPPPPTESQQTPPGKAQGPPRSGTTSDVDSDRAQVPLALEFLANQGAGQDDTKLLGVGMCLKAMGHGFGEFDAWAESAGCTCTDRQARWDSLRATDTDYSAVIGMAVNAGWERHARKAKKPGGKQKPGAAAVDGNSISRNSVGLAMALEVFGLKYRRNIRRGSHELRGSLAANTADGVHTPEEWLPLNNVLLARLKELLAERFTTPGQKGSEIPCRMSVDAIAQTFNALAAWPEYRVDPWNEWLKGLPAWDGRPRVDTFFQSAWGAEFRESHQYLAAASWNVFGPGVGRTYQPGIPADCCPVLLGGGGNGKSSGLQELFPPELRDDLYSEGLDLAARDKEWVEKSLGSVIAEFSELTGAAQADVERLKMLLSRRNDSNIRLAYERAPTNFPRQWTGVGTANPQAGGILPDDQNNRRFIVVRLPGDEQDVAKQAARAAAARTWIAANKTQLWAEALAIWNEAAGQPFWLTMKNAVAVEQRAINTDLRRSDVTASAVADDIDEHGAAGNPEALVSEALTRLGSRANPSRKKVWGRLAELGWTRGWRWTGDKSARQWLPPEL